MGLTIASPQEAEDLNGTWNWVCGAFDGWCGILMNELLAHKLHLEPWVRQRKGIYRSLSRFLFVS
jgi:hypothetical protein